jgi:phage antirepressor YoqD-like protein
MKKQANPVPEEKIYTIHELAKEIGIGPNHLFGILKFQGILQCNNLPNQPYVDDGYLTIEQVRYVQCIPKARITQKGMDYFKKMFKEEKIALRNPLLGLF